MNAETSPQPVPEVQELTAPEAETGGSANSIDKLCPPHSYVEAVETGLLGGG